MEVPVVQRLSDFQVSMNSLHNPSFFAGIQSVSIAYNFCKWGAVIIALVATFGSIISRVKILIIRLRRGTHNSLPSLSISDDDYSSGSDDDEPYSPSLSLSSDFQEEEEDRPTSSSSFFTWRRTDEDFTVRGCDDNSESKNGNVKLQRCRSIGDIFSFSEIANSKSVVKLWDSIGFGLELDFEDCDFFSGTVYPVPAVSTSSPAVVVSAGENDSGNLGLQVWDTRLRQGIPAMIAEWEPQLGKIVGVGSGGTEKVYVRDDAGYGVTVGDMRNVRSPLKNVTESDVDTWWDADAVIVSDQELQRK